MSTALKRRNIPFSPPDMTDAEAKAVVEALMSGWITTGPRTKKLEKTISEYVHTERTVCLNSATAAMEMVLRILGVGDGDEVIMPAYTYTASASVVAHVGATIVMIDSQKESVEMDYEKLAEAITERTKVILPVDIAGICADVDKIKEIITRPDIVAKYKAKNDIQKLIGRIVVSNDCAHSFGASRKGKMAGELTDFSSFSFHAVKNFTTAEGGAMTWKLSFGKDIVEHPQVYGGSVVPFIEGETWNDFIYRLSQLFSLHGQNKDALAKTKLGAWEYDIIGPWYKCNMTDIMAAIGLVQFERYPDILKKRFGYVEYMNNAIDKLNLCLDADHQVSYLNHRSEDHCSSHHLYIVRLKGRGRDEVNKVIEQMAERGIATNVHYKPLPMMTAYKALGFDIKNYPNAYNLFENEITLPLNTSMSMEDVEYVMENFVEIIKSL